MGEWVEVKRPWWDPTQCNCSFCGRLIARRMWVTEVQGREQVFCSPKCQDRYERYRLLRCVPRPVEGGNP